MKAMDNFITFSVEGLDAEHGHVKAAEFIDSITHLLAALNGIDRLVGETVTPSLYYRVVDAGHSSPLTLKFQPVLRRNAKKVSQNHLKECHDRFFEELSEIRRTGRVSDDIDTKLLEHLRDLAIGIGQDFKQASISNNTERVPLDVTFEKNIQKLLDEEDVSYGGFEGMLEAVNIHAESRRFWIYPKLGAEKVRCYFLPGTNDQIREALGHYVRVVGLKFFRSTSPFPFKINVKEFEILSDEKPVALKDLGGIAPRATGNMSSVDFVRKIRDEWD